MTDKIDALFTIITYKCPPCTQEIEERTGRPASDLAFHCEHATAKEIFFNAAGKKGYIPPLDKRNNND